MIKVDKKQDLEKLIPLFQDIRFYMGRSVLDGSMGSAYADKIENPNIALLFVRKYCFISGTITKEKLKEWIDTQLNKFILIPSGPISHMIEELYQENLIISERHSIKKEVIFDQAKLIQMINTLDPEFQLQKIDPSLAQQIRNQDFIVITDNYEQNGIGFACLHKQNIIGVASSNIFYQDGIEVNIKVAEQYRRKGIASALAAKLILECIHQNKKISWDAANMNSVGLAQKLGFKYDSTYHTYKFKNNE